MAEGGRRRHHGRAQVPDDGDRDRGQPALHGQPGRHRPARPDLHGRHAARPAGAARGRRRALLHHRRRRARADPRLEVLRRALRPRPLHRRHPPGSRPLDRGSTCRQSEHARGPCARHQLHGLPGPCPPRRPGLVPGAGRRRAVHLQAPALRRRGGPPHERPAPPARAGLAARRRRRRGSSTAGPVVEAPSAVESPRARHAGTRTLPTAGRGSTAAAGTGDARRAPRPPPAGQSSRGATGRRRAPRAGPRHASATCGSSPWSGRWRSSWPQSAGCSSVAVATTRPSRPTTARRRSRPC